MVTTTTGLATSFINFTRASNATVTNNVGNIAWAGHNFLTNSESFDASVWNRVNATPTANTVLAPNGTITADTITTVATTGASNVNQNTTRTQDISYTFACFVRPGNTSRIIIGQQYAASSFTDNIVELTTGAVIASTAGTVSWANIGSGWYFVSVTVISTGSGNFQSYIGPLNSNATGFSNTTAGNTIHVWGAHLYRNDLGGMVYNPAQPAGFGTYYPTTPRNLIGFTEDFGNAYWTLQGGTTTSNIVLAPNGLQTADLFTESSASTSHSIAGGSITATTVTASVYAKANGRFLVLGISAGVLSGSDFVSAVFDLNTGICTASNATGAQTLISSAITSAGNGWYRCSVTGRMTATFQMIISLSNVSTAPTSNYARNAYTVSGTSEGVYIWGAQLSDSASIDPYSPVYGTAVTSSAYYAPRLDYDPVNVQPRGILIEEQRTSIFPYSEDLSVWTKASGTETVTADTVVSPSGLQTADTVQRSGTNWWNGVRQSVTVSTNTVYTFSCFVKAGNGDPGIVIAGGTVLDIGIRLNNGTPAIISNTGSSPVISYGAVPAGNNWWRVYATFNTSSASAVGCGTADGSAVNNAFNYFWGGQLEAGSFPTSYIPTSASQVTRSPDDASLSTQAFPYSSLEGCLVVNFSTNNSTATQYSMDDGNSGYDNYRSLYFNFGSGDIAVFEGSGGGTFVTNTTIYNGASSTNFSGKAAYAYATSSAGAAVNGTSISLSASGAPALNLTRLGIGRDYGYGGSNGIVTGTQYLRQITYIPRRLTNTELQTRTT